MIGSSRIAPVSLLLATTLSVVPILLPGGLLGGGASASGAIHTPHPTALVVHLKLAPLLLPAKPAHAARPARTSPPAAPVAHLPVIPLSRPARSAQRAQGTAASHTIVAGDTLWALASTAGLTVPQLAAANHLSEDATLQLGQVLQVPARGSAPAMVPAAASARPAQGAPRQALANRVQMLWPASGMITSRFGWRIQPIFRRPEFHEGLDIATRWGSPVLAARGGVVRFVGWQSGYGRMVIVSHGGGLETSYSHLSAAVVQPGQQVAPGQLIGRIGSTGWSTGPHLLFEVRWHGVPVDPTRYLH